MGKEIPVSFRIEPYQKLQIELEAVKAGLSTSDYVRGILHSYVHFPPGITKALEDVSRRFGLDRGQVLRGIVIDYMARRQANQEAGRNQPAVEFTREASTGDLVNDDELYESLLENYRRKNDCREQAKINRQAQAQEPADVE